MLPGRIVGSTRVLYPEGPKDRAIRFSSLAVRDDSMAGIPAMVSAWIPTPDEIARIVLGAPILLCVMSKEHPPIALEVGVTGPQADVQEQARGDEFRAADVRRGATDWPT